MPNNDVVVYSLLLLIIVVVSIKIIVSQITWLHRLLFTYIYIIYYILDVWLTLLVLIQSPSTRRLCSILIILNWPTFGLKFPMSINDHVYVLLFNSRNGWQLIDIYICMWIAVSNLIYVYAIYTVRNFCGYSLLKLHALNWNCWVQLYVQYSLPKRILGFC